MKNHLVVALAYDRLCTFELGCVVEIFALERPELGLDWYRFAVCAVEPGPIRALGGFSIAAPWAPELLAQADTIVIPGWRDPTEQPAEALLDSLRAAHQRGARLASICSGVFVLAAAGLLDGRSATTHWRYARQLAEQFPRIKVQANALYVDEGPLLTSAGSAAGLDMMLHLVRRDHGARVANAVAQRLVIPPHRVGDQAQFVARPLPSDEGARLSRLMEWTRSRLDQPHTLASLAEQAAMSIRTLQRQFQRSTGLSPLAWLIAERVELAKELLETTERPMALIATAAGFGSEESFRRHFRRQVGTSPMAYREHFKGREGN
ncbi:transcriptional regulator FtrA [Chitinimonas lacunae]|uniref:Transcriptional regulator FtrA n=1 Tax=Chitinimonas lacunae TaxID=1963018 RepID=A0ABV8MLL7_9NEIS